MKELIKIGDITPIDFMKYRDGALIKKKGFLHVLDKVALEKFHAVNCYVFFNESCHRFEVYKLQQKRRLKVKFT
jgi:hypothetical protein